MDASGRWTTAISARTWGCSPPDRNKSILCSGTTFDMQERRREPDRSPGSMSHDPMELSDGMTKFCAKCGRILGYRAARNIEWIATEAANRGCDWGS
jgi:hypothetical protein